MLLQLLPHVLSSLSFFLLLISSTLTKAQLEGRPCVANQTLGVYKPLEQCPSLLKKGFKSSSAPIVPGSDYSDSIICCINDAADNNIWSISTAPTPDSHAKAKAKCEEYSRLADSPSIPLKAFLHVAKIGYTSNDGILRFLCTGTVISKRFVLIAAHCTHYNIIWVRVGDLNHDNTDDDANIQDIQVIKTIRHPLYNKSTASHNIALVKLEKNIHFNEWVRPACLPCSLPDSAVHKAIAIGRNETDLDTSTDKLLQVTMRLVPQLECNVDSRPPVRGDRQLCARELAADTCSADGPLVIVNSDHARMYSLIGIASYGPPCPTFTVYTRVYYYVPWIESIVWPN